MRQALAAPLLVSLLLAGAHAAVAAEPATTAPSDAALELKRVNLVVADLDRALTIYRDILGFRVFEIHESSPQSYSYPVFRFPRAAKLRFASLDSASQQRALALTEVRGVPLPARSEPYLSTPVIRVGRFDAVLAALRARGLVVVEPRSSSTPEGASFREMAFTDFDGNLVVLYQLDARPQNRAP
jgi:catechol 2,3-dioxygenase-like lactoylglutathione lyase family enzyme